MTLQKRIKTINKSTMHKFTEWMDQKEACGYCASDTKLPERGDVVIKRPSAVFWSSRKPKSSWVKCPSNRNLDNSSMTMLVISGDQDFGNDGKFPAINTSRAANRSRKKVFLDPDDLFDITDMYKPEERKSKSVWVHISSESKYRDIYKQWQKECQEEPIKENNHYKNMWKMEIGESKVYREYPTE